MTQSPRISSVYGPVLSWRFGRSLGVDPIGKVSTCSFNCVYCQLGEIVDVTDRRREFIALSEIIEDLASVDWGAVDVVTISGSGEPTLATNLAEIVGHLKARYDAPVHVLTNATLFDLEEARAAVAEADVVSCKLDAATQEALERINRPAPGVTMDGIIEGILALKARYAGRLELQIMFMPLNLDQIEALAKVIKKIRPAEVQLNTPRRPYPAEWHIETRGAHDRFDFDWPTSTLAVISRQEARSVEDRLRRLTGVPIVSVYGPP